MNVNQTNITDFLFQQLVQLSNEICFYYIYIIFNLQLIIQGGT